MYKLSAQLNDMSVSFQKKRILREAECCGNCCHFFPLDALAPYSGYTCSKHNFSVEKTQVCYLFSRSISFFPDSGNSASQFAGEADV